MRDLEAVYCDKAYISRRNVQFIADVGAYPAIEPKNSSSVNSTSHRAYGQLMRSASRKVTLQGFM